MTPSLPVLARRRSDHCHSLKPLIAAGVNAKTLSTYMGHASITTTMDRYGHLMPGNEAEAARLLGTYLSGQAQALSD